MSFGYKDQVSLPFLVTVHKKSKNNILSKDPILLEPEFQWLVCKEVCVPGKATLSLTVPVGSKKILDPKKQAFFAAVTQSLPVPLPATISISGDLTPEEFVLRLNNLPSGLKLNRIFPIRGDDVNHAAQEKLNQRESELEIRLKRSDRLIDSVKNFPALLLFTSLTGEALSYTTDFPIREQLQSVVTAQTIVITNNPATYFMTLIFALLGGLLLNLMPCVFPVLSIKALGILKMGGQDKKQIKSLGWAYTFGVLISFWMLVSALLILRAGGQQLGWGFQLQSPTFLFGLACVLYLLGLNLLGFFEISGSFVNTGDRLTQRAGWIGSFFTGMLATLVATPCTAPFMGSAIGFAFGQPPIVLFLIFTTLGIGLALPYLLVCYLPTLAKLLPRPGQWMETFKQSMAFLLFGTMLWLAWVLSMQVQAIGLVYLIAALIWISFCVWWVQKINRPSIPNSVLKLIVVILGFFVIFSLGSQIKKVQLESGLTRETSLNESELNWEKFSPEKVVAYQAAGRPVFVDFTAAWCVSCHVNEAMVFSSDEVKQKLKAMNFALLKADWTNQDDMITKTLHAFGRDGVPFYLIYPKGKDVPAIPLPEIITAGIVMNELEKLK